MNKLKNILLPKIVLTFHCLNKLFKSSPKFCKFLAFSLEFPKFFLNTRTIFLTVGQNNFDNKIPTFIDPLAFFSIFPLTCCGKLALIEMIWVFSNNNVYNLDLNLVKLLWLKECLRPFPRFLSILKLWHNFRSNSRRLASKWWRRSSQRKECRSGWPKSHAWRCGSEADSWQRYSKR